MRRPVFLVGRMRHSPHGRQSEVDGRGDMAGFSPCFPVTDMRAVLAPPIVTHDGAAHKS